ncbi:uncharacterized protein LOC142583427 isoform X1 [Dermacentor variabilis]|uniref:uncharacterized protein LOC142583427 isoform X1 n=1 Tax=Dermacentor variabilis TaxID=34621 RepID=UPI003F5BE18B
MQVWLGLQKSCKQTAVLLISADLHVRVGPTTSRHHGAFTRGIRALCVKNAEHCGCRGKEAEGPEQAPGHHSSGCKIKMETMPTKLLAPIMRALKGQTTSLLQK